MDIGSKLKSARNEKGITQEMVAETLGVSRQTISNWENNKSYPDIISVIKMSDLYSMSLDHLLKEGDAMNQTYHEFLEESTNTVKAKRRLGEILMIATYFIVWLFTMILLWFVQESKIVEFGGVLRWIILPLLSFLCTLMIAKNNYFGKGKWFSVIIVGITFLTVPLVNFTVENEVAFYTFQFPNIPYMLVGIGIAVAGTVLGTILKKSKNAKEQ